MSFLCVHRRFTTWLALLAMVMGALAPAAAQAVVASTDRAQWVEVCSASGMLWVKAEGLAAAGADLADHDTGGPLADTRMHCPWCSLHGGAAGLPPAPTALELTSPQSEPPPAFFHAALLCRVWALAHARAPPSAA